MPIENKIWLTLIVFAALIGIGYTAHYFTTVDNANAALLERKSSLASYRDVLETKRAHWNQIKEEIQEIKKLTEQKEVLIKAKEIIDKRFRTIESEVKYTISSMRNAVESVRSSAPGSQLGDITLANGKVLRGAKVRAVDTDTLSLIHADGIGIVPLDLLPGEIKQRYDLGDEAIMPQLQIVESLLTQK